MSDGHGLRNRGGHHILVISLGHGSTYLLPRYRQYLNYRLPTDSCRSKIPPVAPEGENSCRTYLPFLDGGKLVIAIVALEGRTTGGFRNEGLRLES